VTRGATVKLEALVPVPAGVVTEIGPEVAFVGTCVVIEAEETTVNDETLTPLNFTAVAPLKFKPVIVTEAPTAPLVGLKDVTLGATVNVPLLVPVPDAVVTLILPVVAPDGTDVAIWVAEVTVKVALVPLKVTAVAPVKFEPVIVTDVPAAPLVGVNEVIEGTAAMLNHGEGERPSEERTRARQENVAAACPEVGVGALDG